MMKTDNIKFGEEQENIVSKILWEIINGQSQENALEILRQCESYVKIHKELYLINEKKREE